MTAQIKKDVCIVGGGPAGMFAGLLLAKSGLDVLVIEKNPDFQREFRGEVLQPRFLQLLTQLNLREYIESFPHKKLAGGNIFSNNHKIASFEFEKLNQQFPYSLWMPQPILLKALFDLASKFPSFEMWFKTRATELITKNNGITGLRVKRDEEDVSIQAKVVIGSDGRFSTLSQLQKMEYAYYHHKNDVIWFNTSKPENWEDRLTFQLTTNHNYILLPKYPDLIQGGITMRKGEWRNIQERGIEPLKKELQQASWALGNFAESLKDFHPFHLLQAKLFMLKKWSLPGLILIGDAAHCASPVGAIGVSLAVGTAIVAADEVFRAIHENDLSEKRLNRIQEICEPDIRRIHKLQKTVEKTLLSSSWLRHIRPHIIQTLAHTPLFTLFQRKIFLVPKTKPINEKFIFTSLPARKLGLRSGHSLDNIQELIAQVEDDNYR